MMTLTSKSVATGYVHALCFDGPVPDWDTIRRLAYTDELHPQLTEKRLFKNTLTDYAVQAAAGLWVDKYVKTPSRIVLGTGQAPIGQTDPLPSDEALWTIDATTDRVCDVRDVFMAVYSEYGITYQTTELDPATTYTEAGLLDADGKLWAHVKLNLTKTSTQTAVILWKVYHQGV